jgi:hypothetical protein
MYLDKLCELTHLKTNINRSTDCQSGFPPPSNRLFYRLSFSSDTFIIPFCDWSVIFFLFLSFVMYMRPSVRVPFIVAFNDEPGPARIEDLVKDPVGRIRIRGPRIAPDTADRD